MLVLLGLGTAFALRWYWGRAPHPLSDTTMAIYRAFEVDRSIGQGVLYPRLAMDFNFTYGAPLLQYRPPLVHYVIPAFHWAGLGWIDAAKITASIELLLAGIGVYVYARWLFRDRRAALVSAAAYLFAPYLLLDIQERGAIGEAAALAVLPWLFWAMHHTLENESRLWPWLSALFAAVLILAHNIIALFAVPVLLFYLCLLAWRGHAWRRTPAVLAALAGGLGLSAFYWMPALLERGYAQIESRMLDQAPDTWLSPLSEWIQRQVVFDYWGSLHFQLSLWQAVLVVIATLALGVTAIADPTQRARDLAKGPEMAVLSPSRGLRFNMVLLAGITVGVMLLQLDVSRPFWNNLPLVRFIQFPWRLLGIAAFCIAVLAGFLFTCAAPRCWRGKVPRSRRGWRGPGVTGILGWAAAVGLLAIVLYGSTFMLAPQFNPYKDQLSEDAVSLEGLFERGRLPFTIFSDFLPAGVKVDPRDLAKSRPAPDSRLSPMTYVPAIEVTGDQPFRLKLRVRSDQPFALRLHRFFFPGWQVYVAGKPVSTGPSGDAGLVTADLPRGEYSVMVQFGRTPLRSLADIITLISLLAWIAVGISIRQARPILVAIGAILILATTLMVVRHGGTEWRVFGSGEALPTAYAANFQDEIHLLGYQLPERSWQPGDDLPLRLYWLAQRTPAADYKVFVHLVKPDDSARVAQSDNLPVLGYSPTTRWEPGEIIVDEHKVHLDENVAPGKYLLLVGMYQPETMKNLPVRGAAQALPGNRVVVTQIEVQAR